MITRFDSFDEFKAQWKKATAKMPECEHHIPFDTICDKCAQRVDVIGTNGNEGLHYCDHRMTRPTEIGPKCIDCGVIL